jgi:hypothetical protein
MGVGGTSRSELASGLDRNHQRNSSDYPDKKSPSPKDEGFWVRLMRGFFGRQAHSTEVSSIQLALTVLSVSSRLIQDRAHSDERAIEDVQRDQYRLSAVRIL